MLQLLQLGLLQALQYQTAVVLLSGLVAQQVVVSLVAVLQSADWQEAAAANIAPAGSNHRLALHHGHTIHTQLGA